MTPDTLIQRSTRTIVSFEPGLIRYQHRVTGERFTNGRITFDCGHSYIWHPHGVTSAADMPSAGKQDLCARCLEGILDAAKEAQA